jgi:hypothetical protein
LPFDENWEAGVDLVLRQFEHHALLRALRGWAYYDPLLRFLYTVDLENCARLKAIKFAGKIKLYTCRSDICGPCDDGVVGSIRLYIPFIKKFCTGLEKLTISVEEDKLIQNSPWVVDPNGPQTSEEALAWHIYSDIREIQSLKELMVLDGSFDDEPPIDDAEDAVKWFKERTRQSR